MNTLIVNAVTLVSLALPSATATERAVVSQFAKSGGFIAVQQKKPEPPTPLLSPKQLDSKTPTPKAVPDYEKQQKEPEPDPGPVKSKPKPPPPKGGPKPTPEGAEAPSKKHPEVDPGPVAPKPKPRPS